MAPVELTQRRHRCQRRPSTLEDCKDVPTHIVSSTTTMPRTKTRGPWGGQEDDVLRGLVFRYGPQHWSFIASQLGTGRVGKQCRERYEAPSHLFVCLLVDGPTSVGTTISTPTLLRVHSPRGKKRRSPSCTPASATSGPRLQGTYPVALTMPSRTTGIAAGHEPAQAPRREHPARRARQ